MIVRMRGHESVKPGGTAGILSCPSNVVWDRFFCPYKSLGCGIYAEREMK